MDRGLSALIAGATVLTAGAVGATNGPQRPATAAWYGLLRKPGFTPSGRVIAPAWGILELLLAGTGYRLLQAPGTQARSAALGSWCMTLLGLAIYPWLFFGRKRLGTSALASGAMLVSAAATVVEARKVDKPAAAMTVPLLFWLSFATILSEELWRENKR